MFMPTLVRFPGSMRKTYVRQKDYGMMSVVSDHDKGEKTKRGTEGSTKAVGYTL